MKTIILYYSFTGNNAWLASALAEKLGCDALQICEAAPRKKYSILLDLLFNRQSLLQDCPALLDTYDLVIFIAPVWASRIATPMATFLRKQRDNISNYAFVSFCSGVSDQEKKLKQELFSLLGKKPVAFAEIKVNDLLPPGQRNKIRYTTPYRVKPKHYSALQMRIDDFIHHIIDFQDQNFQFIETNNPGKIKSK
jgi:flavodoxin